MIGYKLLREDMTTKFGKFMKYELNKTYEIPEETVVEMCKNGYHFCNNIEDTLIWYESFENNKLFVVSTCNGMVITNDENNKSVSSKIKLLEEIPLDEIREYLKSNIDRLVNHPHYRVRKELARQGIALDVLINDPNELVRLEVAKHGYGLQKLITDPSLTVRYAVDRYIYAERIFGIKFYPFSESDLSAV